ncbi:MAG: NAD(+)/NADH kinase [Acidobacteria bacterium]|nr:NAD(+)/NADH kinase [Acidobacteriota bacterium]
MITRVGIVTKPNLTAVSADLPVIVEWLRARGVEAVFDTDTAGLTHDARATVVSRDDLPRHVDLILLLGGDGTLLGMADRVAQADLEVPILGVNFGGLGFLTEITYPEMFPSLEAALAGTALVESRMMLRARVERNGATLHDRRVLNDVSVTGGSLSRIVEFVVSVGGEFVASFHADGIILATPTGSTAYNLSAGGPIVHPAVDALVLNPIAPHTLTNRPVVIPADGEVVVQPRAKGPDAEAFVTFDGQAGERLETADIVRVQRAPRPVRLVRASTRSYYQVLRQKLRWAER